MKVNLLLIPQNSDLKKNHKINDLPLKMLKLEI